MKRGMAVAIGSALAACTTLPPPAVVEQFDMDYAALAACTYQRVSAERGAGIRFADLRALNTATINFDLTEGMPGWEAKFVADGARSSRVELRAFPSIWGPEFNARQVREHILACATRR